MDYFMFQVCVALIIKINQIVSQYWIEKLVLQRFVVFCSHFKNHNQMRNEHKRLFSEQNDEVVVTVL